MKKNSNFEKGTNAIYDGETRISLLIQKYNLDEFDAQILDILLKEFSRHE